MGTSKPFPKFDGGVAVNSNGYLRIKAGPLRDVYVHTVVMEAKLGRKLRPDESVDHIDKDRLNCAPDNLQVVPKKEHSAVTARRTCQAAGIVPPTWAEIGAAPHK